MTIENFKSLLRPFMILSAWILWLIMIATGMVIPTVFAGVIALITGEFFVERAYKRFKE